MKIKYSALVSGARNKLNGSVASRNRYGDYFRNKTTPVNPQTSYQQGARATFTALSQAWRGLTQDQRNAWNSAAQDFPFTDIFGDIMYLSGAALYLKLNANLLKINQSTIDEPPAPQPVTGVTSVTPTLTTNAGALTASVAFTMSDSTVTGETLVVYACGPVSAGKTYVKNLLRLIATEGTIATPYVATTAYTARFGEPAEGQKIAFRLAIVNNSTGQQGTPAQGLAVVTTA